ncbi:protease pro-enzyme activation domain-containing protein [Dyella sp. S184]|uniref:protease pro-enzyme activation domain-containing protein n=1 Tax=Dyella sp. S184 TaxID=1641862 RepID=UPI00131B662C|nr:protease pro-enzyme activation domain-containing protein [Dyella sp. S184]
MKMLYNSRLTALAMTVSLALAAVTVMSVHADGVTNGMGAAVTSATKLRSGDAFAGVLPHTQPMHVVIALKLRNSDQLNGLVAAHQTLTPAQLSADYEPTVAQAQAVATYLTQLGFTHVVIAPNRLLVSADGTADTAQAAFQTSFARVQTHDGRAAFANTSDAHVPTPLQGSVLSVMGLQNVYVAHSFAQRAQASAATAPLAGHNPLDFSPIYSATGVPTAAGVTVGIVSVGDMTQPPIDLGLFTTANNLATVNTQTIYVEPDSGDTSGTDEWDIDSQDIVGAGGGQVGQLIFYATPSFSFADLNTDFNAVVVANQAKVIDVSIGGCETSAKTSGAAAASDQIFQLAVAQGQTFSISTGDSGADECGDGGITPSWPADSPYVVAAAGTHLTSSATAWEGEVVWDDLPYHGATGGSPSTFEPKPSWQSALVPGTMRGVADIAFEADPFTGTLIYVNGGIQLWGGTSLASPIFVGLWARVIAVKGTGVGFAAPLLYQLPATDFHDIISGNNGGETAKVGYDFATGRGSVILSSAIQHIGVTNPLVANFSETSSGLSAKFTDSSTDSGGTITAHAWTFGDGGTATAASPSHIYLKGGTYSVTETVTGQSGWAATQTASVTIK